MSNLPVDGVKREAAEPGSQSSFVLDVDSASRLSRCDFSRGCAVCQGGPPLHWGTNWAVPVVASPDVEFYGESRRGGDGSRLVGRIFLCKPGQADVEFRVVKNRALLNARRQTGQKDSQGCTVRLADRGRFYMNVYSRDDSSLVSSTATHVLSVKSRCQLGHDAAKLRHKNKRKQQHQQQVKSQGSEWAEDDDRDWDPDETKARSSKRAKVKRALGTESRRLSWGLSSPRRPRPVDREDASIVETYEHTVAFAELRDLVEAAKRQMVQCLTAENEGPDLNLRAYALAKDQLWHRVRVACDKLTASRVQKLTTLVPDMCDPVVLLLLASWDLGTQCPNLEQTFAFWRHMTLAPQERDSPDDEAHRAARTILERYPLFVRPGRLLPRIGSAMGTFLQLL